MDNRDNNNATRRRHVIKVSSGGCEESSNDDFRNNGSNSNNLIVSAPIATTMSRSSNNTIMKRIRKKRRRKYNNNGIIDNLNVLIICITIPILIFIIVCLSQSWISSSSSSVDVMEQHGEQNLIQRRTTTTRKLHRDNRNDDDDDKNYKLVTNSIIPREKIQTTSARQRERKQQKEKDIQHVVVPRENKKDEKTTTTTTTTTTKKTSESNCIDSNNKCIEWSKNGECNKNIIYMLQNCRKSCQICFDNPTLTRNQRKIIQKNQQLLKDEIEKKQKMKSFHELQDKLRKEYDDDEKKLQILTKQLTKQREIFLNEMIEIATTPSTSPNYYSPEYICNNKTLSNYLSLNDDSYPVKGMHIICIFETTTISTSTTDEKSNSPIMKIQIFPQSIYSKSEIYNITKQKTNSNVNGDISWFDIHTLLTDKLKLRESSNDLHQPWAIFNPIGERIVHGDLNHNNIEEIVTKPIKDKILYNGMIILFEGGQWIYPGVYEGYKRNISLYYPYISYDKDDEEYSYISKNKQRNVILETLSLRPLVFTVNEFLSNEECTYIQNKAKPTMRSSTVSFTDQDKGNKRKTNEFRTSSNTFLSSHTHSSHDGSSNNDNNEEVIDEILQDIEYRTASLVKIPKKHQEQTQVLKYEKTQFYVSHHDFFNPIFYKNDKHTLKLIQNGKRNRLATVFWYLSDVNDGGETIFPRYGGKPQPKDFHDCTIGLKVQPKLGKVIIFYSMLPDGTLDELSLHGSCPVKDGIKWAANKWIWSLPNNMV